MANSVWCVKPLESAPVDLTWTDPDGNEQTFWVKFKQRLTIGEDKAIQTSGWTGFRPRGGNTDRSEIGVDWREQSFTRTLTWLTAWSLEDEDRKRLPITRGVVESLHPDVYALIEDAITEHVKAAEEEKKAKSGGGASQPKSA